MKTKEKCFRCGGRGFKSIDLRQIPWRVVICRLCGGVGKVDWVGRVIGAKSVILIPKVLRDRRWDFYVELEGEPVQFFKGKI